jgi:DNA repair exonuclease SbcCD ATPase subunit
MRDKKAARRVGFAHQGQRAGEEMFRNSKTGRFYLYAMTSFLIICLICFFSLAAYAETDKEILREIRDVKERVIRLEEGLKATNQRIDGLEKSINQRIDGLEKSINQRIDDLRNLMLWGYGILFGGMGILIGFVIWDRRTALAPAVRKSKELEEREERIERALREYAQKEPGLAEALKNSGLM